jgi:ribosomal-protein-alanine N-acetyltransferase
MRAMPVLETERVQIRPFFLDDVNAAHRNAASIGWVDEAQSEAEQLAVMREYIRWCSLNHRQLAMLYQPPYGDRAVVLKATNELIGSCGLVPVIDPVGVFPYFGGQPGGYAQAEVGLLWTIGAAYQGQGFATEVARTLIDYALQELNLHHIIATTEYDNTASQKVMEKAGMHLERNPFAEPAWLQVLGIAENS